MTDPTAPGSGDAGTSALLVGTLGFLGLLGALPAFLGPAIGGLGGVGAYVLRHHRRAPGGALELGPPLVALAVLTAAAPATPAPELFAGLAALALLLWLAERPGHPAGGARRAVPTIAPAALGVAFAWALTLGLPGLTADIGLAGSLVAGALVALAFLLGHLSFPGRGGASPARTPSEPAPPGKNPPGSSRRRPPPPRLKSGPASEPREPR